MTDEYKKYRESKNFEAVDHPEEVPRWKPPERKPESEDHLEHYGIKGQKWGIRRYQNEDGTRIGKEKSKKGPTFNSGTLKYKKKAQNLTDDELNKRIQRMQKEAQYDQLRKQLQPKTKAQKRKELINTIFIASATTAAAAIMSQVYKKAAAWMLKKASGGRIDISGGKKK